MTAAIAWFFVRAPLTSSSKTLSTGSYPVLVALFCDICGRKLEDGTRFCDICGRKVAVEERPVTHSAARPTGEETVVSKPPDSRLPQPAPKHGRLGSVRRRPHLSRRSLVISAIGLSALTIIAASLVAFPILSGGTLSLPSWLATTSSQNTVTSTAGGALTVQMEIANNPTTLGSIQTITVTVLDSKGQPVPDATVHVEIMYPYTSPSGNPHWEGATDTNGKYALTWQIAAMPDNVGTFQVKTSVTKAGYGTGQAEASFQVTE